MYLRRTMVLLMSNGSRGIAFALANRRTIEAEAFD
jgi:hypothetical protein